MPLELVDQGSIIRPGPIGRLVRLLLGGFCLYGLWELTSIASDFIERPIELLPNLALMILLVLCIFNYVVNIGFGKNWNFYPVLLSVLIISAVAFFSFLISGSPSSPALGIVILIWVGYFYAHLGISFVIAAAIATPGCEMRAIPEIIGKALKREAKEHSCPSSIISGIDKWESNR